MTRGTFPEEKQDPSCANRLYAEEFGLLEAFAYSPHPDTGMFTYTTFAKYGPSATVGRYYGRSASRPVTRRKGHIACYALETL